MITWVEIKAKAIEHNISQFRKLFGRNTLLMPVIKANAYGHGFFEVANILQKNKFVDRICVVNSDEALQLVQKYKKNKPIQILSFFENDTKKLITLAKNNVIFPIYTKKQLEILSKISEKSRKIIKVHLKIDVGTTRLGLLPRDAVEFAKKITKKRKLHLEGIYSHFSSSEESGEVTQQQLKIFIEFTEELKKYGIDPLIKHLTCTAATILYPKSHFNAIRVGIGIYGLHPSNQTKAKIKLRSSLSLHTTVIQIKKVPSNTKVSYDGTYTTSRPTKIAVLPVGYWDGIDRKLSNRGEVLIRGQHCKILGRVCMNLCVVDVTSIQSAQEGDKATIIGKQKNNIITAEDFAKNAETINYEIVDRINPTIPRIVT